MTPDAQERSWRELRERLPAARTRVQAIEARLAEEAASDLAELLVAELGTALEELSVALHERDEEHGRVLELQGMVDTSSRHGREAFDAVPDAIAITDLRGLVVEANAAAARLVRQTPEFLRGKPLAALIAEGSRRRFYDLLEAASADDGGAAAELPFRMQPDGTHRVLVTPGRLASEPVLCWQIADVPSAPALPAGDAVPPDAADRRAEESPLVAAISAELDAARTLAAQLQHALDSRIVIEQAKGRLAERLGITEGEAFELLRRRARATGAKVQLLAQAVVSGELDLS